MLVKDLIEYLKTFPEDMVVAHQMYSEQCLLEQSDIAVMRLSVPREDGWIPNLRPDKPSQDYLVFPGN